MASAEVLGRPKYRSAEEVPLKPLTVTSPLSAHVAGFPHHHIHSPITGRPPVQRLGSSTSSSKSIKSLEVCVFMKDGSGHELYLENAWLESTADLLRKVEDCYGVPPEAKDVFALWIVSPLLQLQLKPHHVPFKLCRMWSDLLDKFTSATEELKAQDEPVICFQRNAFLDKEKEMQLYHDEKIMRWLFDEAKSNILEGNYPCDGEDYEYLGGILAWLSHGRYDPERHEAGFLRNNLREYLPACMCKETNRWSWLRGKTASAAAAILEQRIFQHWDLLSESLLTKMDAIQLYMQFCWKLPFYGCTFFSGQIERSPSGIGFRDNPDRPVQVGLNRQGIFVMDAQKQELLLGLMYDQVSWEYTEPNKSNSDCLPCIWLEFDVEENGKNYSKLLQIFSRQAIMMNALIEACVEELNKKDIQNSNIPSTSNSVSVMDGLLSPDTYNSNLMSSGVSYDETDNGSSHTVQLQRVGLGSVVPALGGMPCKEPKTSLHKKCERLCLSTYTDRGELVKSKSKGRRPFSLTGIFSRS